MSDNMPSSTPKLDTLLCILKTNGVGDIVKIVITLGLSIGSFFVKSNMGIVLLWSVLIFNLPVVIDCSSAAVDLPDCINDKTYKIIHVVVTTLMWLVICAEFIAISIYMLSKGSPDSWVYDDIICIAHWFYYVNLIGYIILYIYKVLSNSHKRQD